MMQHWQESEEERSRREDLNKIDYARSLLFPDFAIPGSNLRINRTAYRDEISNDTTNYEDVVKKVKIK